MQHASAFASLALLAVPAFSAPLLPSSTQAGERSLPSSIAPRGAPLSIDTSVGLQAVSDPSALGDLIGGARTYEARFDPAGVTLVPVLGRSAPHEQTLRLEAVALEHGDVRVDLRAGAPRADGLVAVYDRAPGVAERYRIAREGVYQSFVVDAPSPGASGDLVVRLRLGGVLAETARPDAGGGLRFVGAHGGLVAGGVTGIDADGRTVAGRLSVERDELVLALPAAFVDTAAWPVVLDPLFGAELGISSSANDDAQPDVSYDASNNRYLVVWRRAFALSGGAVRGQMLDPAGAPQGGTIFFGSSGDAGRPQIADANHSSRFVVAWRQATASADEIRLQACDPSTGALSSAVLVASALPGTLSRPDVGGELLKVPFKQVIVVWDQNGIGIRGAKYELELAGDPTFVHSFTIAADVLGFTSHASPAISRTAGNGGLYGVAYLRKSNLISGLWQSYAAVIDRDGAVVNPGVNVVTTTVDALEPDIDGGGLAGGQWVVASMISPAVPPGLNALAVTPIRAGATKLEVGQWVAISGTVKSATAAVGFSLGKAYVVWEEGGLLFDSLKMIGLDPATCMTCESATSVVALLPPGAPTPGICMNASGGNYDDPLGLVVWNEESPGTSVDQDVKGHLVESFAGTGGVALVGGGCGLGGAISAPTSPAVGNGYFSLRLTGADPLAPLAILNVNAPAATLDCGGCKWLPLLLDFTVPVLGGEAGRVVPIPCNPSYVGVQLDAQWTVITPGSSPCGAFPEVSLTDRLRLTLGL